MDDAAKRLIYERNGAGTPRRGPRGSLGSSSDPEGRRIIVERNARHAFGKTPTLDQEDAQLLARMQTNRQARAVLGAIAQTLRVAYEQRLPLYAQIGSAGQQLAAAMRSRLDTVNSYAQRVYAVVPDDDAPVSDLLRNKVGLTFAQARDAAGDIDQTVRSQRISAGDVLEGVVDILTRLVEGALGAVGGALTNRLFPGAGGASKWVKIAVGGVVVLIVGGVVVKLVRTDHARADAAGRGRRSRRGHRPSEASQAPRPSRHVDFVGARAWCKLMDVMDQPKSNTGLWAAVIGVAAVGGMAAAAALGGKKPVAPLRGAARKPLRFVKKPCGCGR